MPKSAQSSPVNLILQKLKEYSVVITTFVIAVFATYITIRFVDSQLKTNLLTRAETIATLLDKEAIQSLSGDESDLQKDTYTEIKQKLMELRKENTDSRFFYLMRETPYGVIFLVDSEPDTSEDYSPPGQLYVEASPLLLSAFHEGSSGLEIAGDRWGVWMTGFAPLKDPATGEVIALLGIDLDYYSTYFFPILLSSLIPVFAFTILLIIILYTKRLNHIEHQVIQEKEQLMQIARHEVGTPMTELKWIAESLLSNHAIMKDESVFTNVIQVYISSNEVINRLDNVLKASDLTVKRKFNLQKIDLVPLLKETIDSFEKPAYLMSHSFQFVNELPKKAFVYGVFDLLQNVFANLVMHSLFYAKEGKDVFVDYADDNDFHVFSFIVTGDKLKEEEMTTLFDAYYKGEPMSYHTEGTGVGLYLIYKIVTMHNGFVSAGTDKNGVTLTIRLPKA